MKNLIKNITIMKHKNPRQFTILAVSFIMTVLCVITVPPIVQASSTQTAASKHVKSVQIQSGDSLWSIAEKNYSEEYGTIEQYITEIKECNNIQSDTIHAGNYLIIPYYQ